MPWPARLVCGYHIGKTAGIQDSWDSRQLGFKTAGIQDSWDSRQLGFKTAGIQDSWDSRQLGLKTEPGNHRSGLHPISPRNTSGSHFDLQQRVKLSCVVTPTSEVGVVLAKLSGLISTIHEKQ